LARKQPGTAGPFSTAGSFDINTVNVYHNPELFNALEVTRAGGNDALFDQMLAGLNLNVGIAGYGPVDGVTQRGSAQIRRAFATALANGNYASVVTSLLTAGSIGAGGLQAVPIDPVTGSPLVTQQRVLRNGCDRIANSLYNSALPANTTTNIPTRCFPENYFVANPQLSSAVYAKNYGYTNYHAFEAQFTMRPTYGMSFQATYGLSKTIAQPGSGFTDPLNPKLDYGRTLSNIGHDFRTNGTVELPIGPNKLLLPNSSGPLARALERWQAGFIFSVSQGAPRSLSTLSTFQGQTVGSNMLYANGRPNIVGPWDNPDGHVQWNGQNGNYFDPSQYANYQDPQCTQRVGTADNLQASCTLQGLAKVVPAGTPGAISVSQGRYGIPLLENPLPGHQGNLGSLTMHTFPRWAFDANISKTFRVSESKSVQFRADALNVLNHPTPDDPVGLGANLTIFSSDNFGQITAKRGNRTFQAKLRLTF